MGGRLPSCDAHSFHRKVPEAIPEGLREALSPVLPLIEKLTAAIAEYDKKIEKICETKYPKTHRLRQIKGVGPLTAA